MMTNEFLYQVQARDVGRLHECDLTQVRELISRYGVVQFEGFNTTPSEFEEFTDAIAPGDPVGEVRIPPGDFILQYHAEDAYTPYRPDIIWLLCVHPGDLGGAATIVADTVETFAEMSDAWQRFCREHHLRFGRLWSSDAWKGSLGADGRTQLERVLEAIPDLTFEFLSDGALYVNYECPFVVRTQSGEESFANSALHAANYPEWHGMTLEDGAPVPDALLSHVHEVIARHEAKVDWDTGDFLAIENYRTMHRRPPYHGSNRVLCRRNFRGFYGKPQPDTSTPTGAWLKDLLMGGLGDDPVYMPIRTGPFDDSWREDRGA